MSPRSAVDPEALLDLLGLQWRYQIPAPDRAILPTTNTVLMYALAFRF